MSNTPKNHWDATFSASHYHYGTEPNDFVKDHTHAIPAGGRVLCIGEGEGRNAVHLAEQGYVVTALDASKVGLEKTTALAASRGVDVTTVHADLNDYDLGKECWDGIVSIFCHLPPTLRHKVHTAIPFALRKEGVFLLEAYRPEQLQHKTGGPSNVDMLYELSTLEEELRPLSFVIAENITRHIEEGRGHNGTSATVQILARHSNY